MKFRSSIAAALLALSAAPVSADGIDYLAAEILSVKADPNRSGRVIGTARSTCVLQEPSWRTKHYLDGEYVATAGTWCGATFEFSGWGTPQSYSLPDLRVYAQGVYTGRPMSYDWRAIWLDRTE